LLKTFGTSGRPPRGTFTGNSDEVLYVLAGRFHVYRADEVVDAAAGTVVLVARGTPHATKRKLVSRMLIIYVPAGGFIEFMTELDGLRDAGMTSAQAMIALTGSSTAIRCRTESDSARAASESRAAARTVDHARPVVP